MTLESARHRGFEKMAEVVDYNGVVPYTDRLNYV